MVTFRSQFTIALRLNTGSLAVLVSICPIQAAYKPPPPNHLFPMTLCSQHGSFSSEAHIIFLGLGSHYSVFSDASSALYQICCVLLYANPGPPIPKECTFHGSSTGALPGIPSVSNCIPHLTGDLIPPSLPHISLALQLLSCSEARWEHIIDG
ncbi:hypothetical protein F4680DRAFT_37763 [Xylaria scruposa]|nr:hypothetical protein F4680DRAFT_37763 [Xylaria scruposa]